MSSIELKSVKSANDSLLLGFIPGTNELVEKWAGELMYVSFDSYNPEEIQFLVTGDEGHVIGCLVVTGKTGKQLFSLSDSEEDEEEMEDWVDRNKAYTYISALEIWEPYQGRGFGSMVIDQIKTAASNPIVLYAVDESVSFWDKHAEHKSGYWFLSEVGNPQ